MTYWIRAYLAAAIAIFSWMPLSFAGSFDDFGPDQALNEIGATIERMKVAEGVLLANTAAAEVNRQEFEGLETEKAGLAAIDLDYRERAQAYNQEVDRYNLGCTTHELDQAGFNACLSWKSSLDARKGALDGEVAGLAAAFADYNARVADYNRREKARAEQARLWIARYDRYSADIRTLQRRLSALGAGEGPADFSARNRTCAGLASLDDMEGCMQALWDGAPK